MLKWKIVKIKKMISYIGKEIQEGNYWRRTVDKLSNYTGHNSQVRGKIYMYFFLANLDEVSPQPQNKNHGYLWNVKKVKRNESYKSVSRIIPINQSTIERLSKLNLHSYI